MPCPSPVRLAAAAVTVLALAGCSGPTPVSAPQASGGAYQPVTVTDCKGQNPATFTAAPKKIVSSNNSGVDLLARVGAADQIIGAGWAKGLVALDEDVRSKTTHVKPLSDGNIDKETLLTSGGDVFLATFESMQTMGTEEPTAEEFKAANMTKVFIKSSACAAHLTAPRTDLAQVYEDITTLATLTGHPEEGRALTDSMRKRIDQARAKIPAGAPQPSVFYWDVAASKDQVTTLGNRQIGNGVYSLAGVKGSFATVDKPFTKASHEQLAAADPDWIHVAVRRVGSEEEVKKSADAAVQQIKQDPRTQNLRAVKEGRFIVTNSEDVTIPGAANAVAVETIIGTVYPR